MGKAEIRPIFLEMLQSLGQLKAATVDVRRSEIMQMACKSAVKGGDALTQSEIRSADLADDGDRRAAHLPARQAGGEGDFKA